MPHGDLYDQIISLSLSIVSSIILHCTQFLLTDGLVATYFQAKL